MIKKLWPYARPYRFFIAAAVTCSACEAVFELLIPLVMSDIVDIGIATGDVDYIMKKGLLMVFMAVISLLFGVGAAAIAARAGQGFGANLRRAEYEHIQEFAFSNIEKFSTASLVTRLTNDVNNLQMTLIMATRIMVRAPVMLISALVLSLRISLQLSAVFAVSIPLLAVLVSLILVKVGPVFRSLQEKTDGLNLVVQENLTGIRVVKSFVREDYEEEKCAKRNEDLKKTSQKAFGTVVINMPMMMLIVYATMIAVMWFGGHMVHAGTMDTGKLMTYFTYIMQIMMSLMMVSMIFMMLTRSVACAKRIIEVLDEVLQMCRVDERFLPTIDFGHLNSRTHGEMSTTAQFNALLDRLENELGTERAAQFHSHFSKIEYTAGGEKKHLTFEDTVFGPEPAPLMQLIADRGWSPTFICESAGTQTADAAAMMALWQAAGGK